MRPRTLSLFLILVVAASAFAASRRRAASADRCSEIVAPATLSFPAAGGHASVTVTVNGGCSWSPSTAASWITAAPASGGISVDVAANSSTTARSGLIHVRGSVIVVTQDAAPPPPSNPNLIVNGSFDTNLAGWSNAYSGNGSASWSGPGIIVAPPSGGPSGVALLTSTDVRSVYQLSQCVNVTGGTKYQAGAKVLIPPGQGDGVVNFVIFEYLVANCTPAGAYHGTVPFSASSPIGTWFDAPLVWTSDLNAKSELVVIGVGGSTAPPFSAYFDDVYLRLKQ